MNQKFADRHGKQILKVSDEVMELIMQYKYNWPGNIRELMNCIESSVVMARGDTINIYCIPEYLTCRGSEASMDGTEGLLQEMERQTITDVLNKTGGRQGQGRENSGNRAADPVPEDRSVGDVISLRS